LGIHLRTGKPLTTTLTPSSSAMKTVSTIMTNDRIGRREPMPRRSAVDSTHIQSAGYRAEEQKLFVKFLGDPRIFVYSNVPARVYSDFQRAKSKGEFFARRIRDVFEFEIREPK
jgi:hypothetical protein